MDKDDMAIIVARVALTGLAVVVCWGLIALLSLAIR